uniref:Uncharacterized protein n=1 Tax=Vespula pensylvanica TaxID=30213 RepID=A0A834PBL7_VESPE|nr:hypothetical protein H0235_003248 [Vespula pensylvanica]
MSPDFNLQTVASHNRQALLDSLTGETNYIDVDTSTLSNLPEGTGTAMLSVEVQFEVKFKEEKRSECNYKKEEEFDPYGLIPILLDTRGSKLFLRI